MGLRKKGVHIAVSLIIVLFLVVMALLVYFGMLNIAFFGGAAYDSAKIVYDNLEVVCGEDYAPGDYEEFEIFLPDYTGNNRFSFRFYYISISNSYELTDDLLGFTTTREKTGELRLNSRSYIDELDSDCTILGVVSGKCRDPLANFVEWVRDNPNQKKLRSYEFKNCADKIICAGNPEDADLLPENCKDFSFEAARDRELISINITKIDDKLIHFKVDRTENTDSDIISNPPAYI